MIVSKPKPGSLFSLSIFSIGGILVGGFSFKIALTGTNVPWYHYLAGLTLFPLAIVILVRIFWTYKIMEFGKEKVNVRYPFRFRLISFSLKEINTWQESQVKNKTGHYREIEIHGPEDKVSLNIQEHSNYKQVLQYLDKKAAKTKSGK